MSLEMSMYGGVFGIGIPLVISQLYCTGWIMHKILKQPDITLLPMTKKFPLYLAFIDFCLSLSLILDQSHSVIFRQVWQDSTCQLSAGIVQFFGSANMILVLAISFTTYLAVCRNITIEYGLYDYKLLSAIGIMSFLTVVFSASSLGPSRYWCYADIYSTDKRVAIVTSFLQFIALTLTITFFTLVYLEISKTVSPDQEIGIIKDGRRITKSIHHQTTMKMVSYVFNYMFQWLPTVPYLVGVTVDYNEDWVYVLCEIGLNLGGILNMLAYIRNEGWKSL